MNRVHKLILQENFVHLYLDTKTHILLAEWVGYLQLQDTQRGCATLIDCVHQYQITRHLSDHTRLKMLKPIVQNYLIHEAFPMLEQVGIRKVAVLTSEDVFAEVTVEKVNAQAATERMHIAMFPSKEKCYQWLLEK